MRPSVEKAVAEALPHGAMCLSRRGALCNCGANSRRAVLLAKLSTAEGYVYLDRR
jgi:hypothetical protein